MNKNKNEDIVIFVLNNKGWMNMSSITNKLIMGTMAAAIVASTAAMSHTAINNKIKQPVKAKTEISINHNLLSHKTIEKQNNKIQIQEYGTSCWIPASFIPDWTYDNQWTPTGSFAFVDNSGTGDNNGVYRLYQWFNSKGMDSMADTAWDAYSNGYSLTINYNCNVEPAGILVYNVSV